VIETKEPLVLDVPEAGRLLHLSRATAYQMAAQGVIPTIRFGKRIVVPKAALERLLERVSPGPDKRQKPEG